MLTTSEEKQAADYVLSLILEEEMQNDQLKKQNRSMISGPVAEVTDGAAVAAEQSFNREQVICARSKVIKPDQSWFIGSRARARTRARTRTGERKGKGGREN